MNVRLAEGRIDCDKSQSALFPHVHDLLATPCANPPSVGRGRFLTVGAFSMNTAVAGPGADELDLSTRAAHVGNRSVQVYQFLESRLAVVLALAGARRLIRAMQLRRAVSGRAAVAPPRSVMNSRRLMCCPQSEDCTLCNPGARDVAFDLHPRTGLGDLGAGYPYTVVAFRSRPRKPPEMAVTIRNIR
jgi:hypothetical protein